MKNGRLYQSPEMDVRLLTESDVLSSSNGISESSDGYYSDGYDLGGFWW
jgi:hypothetical protein